MLSILIEIEFINIITSCHSSFFFFFSYFTFIILKCHLCLHNYVRIQYRNLITYTLEEVAATEKMSTPRGDNLAAMAVLPATPAESSLGSGGGILVGQRRQRLGNGGWQKGWVVSA
ncbi:unnamed protein product [Cuscuta europaea]|uniref:Uncharacterized protein n=1 Tax=Cuscuta europaea TaxID=41803 RepID=A0A9P0ZYK4_CUSEU|nr:unnamed protein product [Cuscuta europaea]